MHGEKRYCERCHPKRWPRLSNDDSRLALAFELNTLPLEDRQPRRVSTTTTAPESHTSVRTLQQGSRRYAVLSMRLRTVSIRLPRFFPKPSYAPDNPGPLLPRQAPPPVGRCNSGTRAPQKSQNVAFVESKRSGKRPAVESTLLRNRYFHMDQKWACHFSAAPVAKAKTTALLVTWAEIEAGIESPNATYSIDNIN